MKAISPVIATVIIVAVAIAISIAVALWMTGITTTFTGLEKLEIVNAYAEVKSGDGGWLVYVTVKNTGTKTTTIDGIFINNQPATEKVYNSTTASSIGTGNSLSVTLDPGRNITLVIELPSASYTPGQTISIVVHTASGGQYPATVTLP